MNFRNSFVTFALLHLFFGLTGCAYNFSGLKRKLPEGYDQVYVAIFKNLTMEPGIETFFTGALIEEIERSHQSKVTPRSDSQVLLEGTINTLDVVQGAVLDSGSDPLKRLAAGVSLAKEYRILITASVVLRRKSDDKIIWGGVFNGEQRYAAPLIGEPVVNSANAPYNVSVRENTIRNVAKEMMAEAHDRLTENF